jgi:SAM-dependent methyltransferase
MPHPRTAPRTPRPHRPGPAPIRRTTEPESPTGRRRFLEWDEYRVEREWRRYEGTPLRDLYRQLRERFLARHRPTTPGRSLEIGPGPGRFIGLIGHPEDRVSLLELSRAMLQRIQADAGTGHGSLLDLVQGDAVAPPFRPAQFHRVVLLGNVLGFAEADARELLSRSSALVSPGGRLLLEFVAGPGERSRYLHRLPAGAIARLLAAPLRAVQPRVEREGFDRVREKETGGRHFWRFTPSEVEAEVRRAGFDLREVIAVGPSLGNDSSKLGAIRAAPTAWAHLLELEEAIGRQPDRQREAAAILLAAERTGTWPSGPKKGIVK